jgi:hypothetical protein
MLSALVDGGQNGRHCPLLNESIRPFVEPEFKTIHSQAHQSANQVSQEQCPCQNLTEVENCTLDMNMKAEIRLLYDKWAGSAHDGEKEMETKGSTLLTSPPDANSSGCPTMKLLAETSTSEDGGFLDSTL